MNSEFLKGNEEVQAMFGKSMRMIMIMIMLDGHIKKPRDC